MGRLHLILASLALLAGCDQSANLNTAITYQPTYAQVRLLNLLPGVSATSADGGPAELGALGAFVDVPNDLPTAWDLASLTPGVTPFTQTVIAKDWTIFAMQGETPLGAYDMAQPTAGAFYTFILTPTEGPPDRGSVAITQALTENPTQGSPTDSAIVEVVSGVPELRNASIQIGSTSVPGPFPPGQEPAQPVVIPLGQPSISVPVTVTPPGSAPLTFPNVPLSDGGVVTLALVGADAASAQLLVVTDTFPTTGQSSIGQSSQVISPMQ